MYNLLVALITTFTMAIHADSWKTSLPVVLFGMLGIFIVIGNSRIAKDRQGSRRR